MQRFQNILISIVGDAPDSAAVERGVRLARRLGARLTLIDAVDDPPWYARLVLPAAERLFEDEVRARGERLEALAASIRGPSLDVETEVLRGRPDIETVRRVLRAGHDLVLKRAEGGDAGLFPSADMRLLRNSPCPVWLVRAEQRSRLFARVLAAVDPTLDEDDPEAERRSALNRKILELTTSLADWDGAELHVVHAWEPFGEGLCRRWGIGGDQVLEDIIERMHAAAGQALERAVAPYLDRIGPAHVHLLRGEAGQAIPRFAADRHIDLIVMGTVARTGISGLLIGNTAETILQRVGCSVLAVKPDGFVSPVTLVRPGESPWLDPGSR
jgi:nucleotide-binding universal stress UspA family protein